MGEPGSRIRLNESCPWPERVGQLGWIATVPDDQRDIYPAAGRGRDEVLVLLDDDPLARPRFDRGSDWWTCAVTVDCVDLLEQATDAG